MFHLSRFKANIHQAHFEKSLISTIAALPFGLLNTNWSGCSLHSCLYSCYNTTKGQNVPTLYVCDTFLLNRVAALQSTAPDDNQVKCTTSNSQQNRYSFLFVILRCTHVPLMRFAKKSGTVFFFYSKGIQKMLFLINIGLFVIHTNSLSGLCV